MLTKSKEGRRTIMTEERRTMKVEEGVGEVEVEKWSREAEGNEKRQ